MDDKNATHLLSADHRTVEELFNKFEAARSTSQKQKIVTDICTELTIHTMLEEEIFYPAVEDVVEGDALEEAYVEHDSAKQLILELQGAEPSEDFYDAKVKVLQELIEHHVKEEERQRDSLFAQTRQGDVDLNAIGEQIMTRKMELKQLAATGKLPPPQLLTSG
jgi:hypothetical protein